MQLNCLSILGRNIRVFGGVSRSISSSSVTRVERLSSRSLLRLSGTEVSSFLQGLVTNDMKHLEDGAPAMYCVFLNTKGRVIYDSIVYRSPKEDGTYFVECATESILSLQKHLKMYRVRRKINIDDVTNELALWVAYGNTNSEINSKNKDLIIVKDPRLKELGYRIITSNTCNVTSELEGVNGNEYTDLRYDLGVGEGVEDLPPGNCFPLEANCDYLHGVSFHKGCYIGQELTARTHHTGVVRKRLMPIKFNPEEGQKLPTADSSITGANDRAVGKIRTILPSGRGIALLRVAEVLKSPENLFVGSLNITTERPTWWPTEVTKERPTS